MKVHVNSVFFGISELLVKSDLWKLGALNCGGTSRSWSVETIWRWRYRKVKGLNARLRALTLNPCCHVVWSTRPVAARRASSCQSWNGSALRIRLLLLRESFYGGGCNLRRSLFDVLQ